MPFKKSLLCGIATALCAPAFAYAQTRPPAEASVSEVVVTALKGSTSVQDTPAAISIIQQSSLIEKGVTDIQGISQVLPQLNIRRSPLGNPGATLHGLGVTGSALAFDQSVGGFFDGVYVTHGKGMAVAIYDLSNIEVIKGTQAALLGKNVSIGAFAINTARPGKTFGYSATAEYEFEYESPSIQGSLNLPVTDTLSLRIAGLYAHQKGYVHNLFTGRDGPDTKTKSVRFSALWTPADNMDVDFMVQVDNRKVKGEFIEPYNDAASQRVADRLGLRGYETTLNDVISVGHFIFGDDYEDDQDTIRSALTARWRFDGGYELTATSGYQFYDSFQVGSVDHIGGYYEAILPEKNQAYSQEFRFNSPTDGRLAWVVGAAYLHDRWSLNILSDSIPAVRALAGPGDFGKTYFPYESNYDNISAYGQFTYALTDQFKVLASARYTHENKTAHIGLIALRPGIINQVANRTYPITEVNRQENAFDPSVGVQYDANEDLMLYASYGQGTKAGGFFTQPTPNAASAEYPQEVARTAEAGFKWSLRGNGLNGYLNVAVFNVEVKDFQATRTAGTNIFFSPRDLRSRGFDVDASFSPTEKLDLRFSAVYADVKDKTSGGHFPYAPKWTGAASATYTQPLGGKLSLIGNLSAEYRDKQYTDLATLGRADVPNGVHIVPTFGPFLILGARLALASEDGWEVALVGRNLTDERPIEAGFGGLFNAPVTSTNGFAIGRQRPSTVALQVSIKR